MINKEILTNWKEVNTTTLSLIKSIPKKTLQQKPFQPRFKSFSWEFACIINTRKGYIRGFERKKLDDNCFLEDEEKSKQLSKEELIKEIKKTNLKIVKILNQERNIKIDYFGEKMSKISIISWLLQHEQFHYGKLILYFAKLNLKLPLEIRKMWGEESFKPKSI